MQNNIRTRLRELHIPKFIIVAASTILGAIFGVIVDRFLQESMDNQSAGYYLMVIVALICLILVIYFLMEIEDLVQNRNFTRFITNKAERLNLMTYYINHATKSIYIISDLSGSNENRMKEHKNYIEALNRVIEDNKGNDEFIVKRIIVPPYASSTNANADPDWIYNLPEKDKEKYRKHFSQLRDLQPPSPKYSKGTCNVSMILIDNKYLFWKPEVTHSNEDLDTLLDGGIYLEDYTREGIANFAKRFQKMFEWAQPIDLERFGPKNDR